MDVYGLQKSRVRIKGYIRNTSVYCPDTERQRSLVHFYIKICKTYMTYSISGVQIISTAIKKNIANGLFKNAPILIYFCQYLMIIYGFHVHTDSGVYVMHFDNTPPPWILEIHF